MYYLFLPKTKFLNYTELGWELFSDGNRDSGLLRAAVPILIAICN